MRAGLSTIQQTLTPEAATVLTHSISEAGRRNHSQTTPLHVASTLLASPTGFLRQACIRSHPNSSHPLQCRALELCFSVALERLPAATSSPAITEPPISNALMAALKRAQAHQRRGCPEQQQQPLLAVKVELEQLIISILDDPSVSRVMREASFSSPAVKATIEQTLNNSVSAGNGNYLNPSSLGIGFRSSMSPSPSPAPAGSPASTPINRNLYLNNLNNQSSSPRNLYLNPRLNQSGLNNQSGSINSINPINPMNPINPIQSGFQRSDDVKRVIDIMTKPKKRNPILVGELEPEAIRTDILLRIENRKSGELTELGEELEVVSIGKEFVSLSDKSILPMKIRELGDVINKRIGSVVIDLGDLKWLVEQPPAIIGCSVGRDSVAEMSKLVEKFRGKVWLFGTATCETYLRCQVYHPSMETDWDLQAVPISSRSSLPKMFPRGNGLLGNSVPSSNPLNSYSFNSSMNLDRRQGGCCSVCSGGYEQELAKFKESEKQPDEVKNSLPQWLQNAKSSKDEQSQSQNKDNELVLKRKIQELQKKWSDECSRIHPRLDRVVPMVMPLTGGYKPNMILRQSPQPRLQPPKTLQEALQPARQPRLDEPASPVGTDLVLGPKKGSEAAVPKDNEDLTVKDLLGCISSEPQKGKFANSADTDSFKRLLKGLMKKAWWQPEAASTIATTITQCKIDTTSRGCIWLLFAGPDRVGKKKMASVLAEHINGTNPITIGLGSRRDDEETDMGFRGKTILDRIAEAVRRSPSSVIVLSDIDEADMLVRGRIKQAMERGRLADSHGREISLGNVVFILTGNWSTANVDEHRVDEQQRLHSLASGDWQLRLTVSEKRLKRRANWLSGKDKSRRQRKESGLDLSLDLNLAVDYEEDRTDGSINSSNLTIDREDREDENQQFAVMSVPHELLGPSDGAVVFKPVNFGNIRREIEKTITNAFSTIVDEKMAIEVEDDAVENILGGLWFGRTSLEEWAEQVLVPSLQRVKLRLPARGEDMVVRLESDRESGQVGGGGDWLPSKIAVVVDGV